MTIREEKLIIGTQKDIQDYLRTQYNIQNRTSSNDPDYFWLNNMNFEQQISNFKNDFGCIFFLHKSVTSFDDQNNIPTIELKMKKLNLWIRDAAWTEEKAIKEINLMEALKNVRDFSNKNIVSHIKLED